MRKAFSAAAAGLLAVLLSSGCAALRRIELEPVPPSVRTRPFPASPSQIPDTVFIRGGTRVRINPPAAPTPPVPAQH